MESSAGKVITHCMLLIVCALFFVIVVVIVFVVDSFQYLPHSQLHFLKLYMHVFSYMLWWSL